MNKLNVSQIGEKKLINRIIKKAEKSQHSYFNIDNLIGDDSAIIDLGNSYLISSSDMLIQKHHFPNEMSYFDMGWKGVTVNVSDLAATGGKPLGFLMNIAIPPDLKVEDFDELIEGILAGCSYYNIPLIGGDTNEGDEIILSGTVLGKNDNKKVLRKSGFKKGDLICITGEIGLAPLGFEFLHFKNNLTNCEENFKLDKSLDFLNNDFKLDKSLDFLNFLKIKALRPIAKLKEGIKLNESECLSSATDISDGLASELHELLIFHEKRQILESLEENIVENKYEGKKCNRDEYERNKSNRKDYNVEDDSIGFMIYEEKIPLINEIKEFAKLINKNYLDLLLHTGEDFELLFTVSNDKINDFKKLFSDDEYYIIGKVNDSNNVEITLLNGEIEKISSKGYEHLKKLK
jgi:thiamine-monophosphate kinase